MGGGGGGGGVNGERAAGAERTMVMLLARMRCETVMPLAAVTGPMPSCSTMLLPCWRPAKKRQHTRPWLTSTSFSSCGYAAACVGEAQGTCEQAWKWGASEKVRWVGVGMGGMWDGGWGMGARERAVGGVRWMV